MDFLPAKDDIRSPFIFGKLAQLNEFTNREKETRQLVTNFYHGINATIISPRRWGKSSLVLQSAGVAAKKYKQIQFCFIDLYNVRTEEEFYEHLAREIIKASATKWDDMVANTRQFLGRLIPKISFSGDDNADFSLGLDWKEIKKHPEDILNLAEKIAESNGKKWVICMDEFQNIADFHQPLAFQKRLRAAWQKQKHISYCLYGSKRHMMMEVFASPSMPFYKFGEILFLEKIKEEDWVKFITKRFADTRKKISVENAALIAQLMENHPYYVQQLAQQCWLRSNRTCNTNIVYQAHDSIAMQLSLLFQSLTDNLSNTQLNFLKAMLEGVEKFSSKDAIHTYRFGTSANVLRIRDALLNKEVIDRVADKYYFIDPVYKYWLKNYYFIG